MTDEDLFFVFIVCLFVAFCWAVGAFSLNSRYETRKIYECLERESGRILFGKPELCRP